MAKIIRTTVNAQGNVALDFAGFVGDQCVAQEQRIRQDLAELGLHAALTGQQRKRSTDCAETRPDARTSL